MAVVQISKIQIRRDVKDGYPADPLPVQLAAGELAWCIDTKQLYIGTYQVSDPENTSNVEILSEGSDIFSIGRYSYGPVTTGKNRSVQERLDDRINVREFGVRGRGESSDPDSLNINQAIIKLYKDSLQGNGRADIRAVLEFSPGIYILEDPIYVYSYTKIIGSGMGSTIFKYTGTGSAFVFVGDTSPNDNSVSPDLDYLNQCKNVTLSGFTLEVEDSNTTAFDMFCVRNSEFKNLDVKSTWTRDFGGTVRENSVGLLLGSKSEQITCKDNQFVNISIDAFRLGISARGDIINNVIRDCKFSYNEISINFGYYNTDPALVPPVGERYGPRNNVISTCVFRDVQKHAIKVWQGYGNVSSKNACILVGNNFGGNIEAAFGQIEFDQPNNLSVDDHSDRPKDLGKLGSDALIIVPYIGEFTGYGLYNNNFTTTLSMSYSPNSQELFRFPVARSSTPSVGPESMNIEIEYLYRSLANDIAYRRLRKGKLTLLVDTRNNASSVPVIDFIDEYDYLGYGLETGHNIEDIEDISFEFVAVPVEQNNQWQVKVSYKYNISPDRLDFNGDLELGTLTYTYRILS
jgi:hypothetical protein